jgi:hypothetical protein
VTPCLVCGVTPRRLHSDHCHRHDRQRGRICPRCNGLMRWIDRGNSPQVTPEILRHLIAHAARCPDCTPIEPAALIPTGQPAKHYQVNTAIPDELAASLKTYAESYGISLADAVRILLRQALKEK